MDLMKTDYSQRMVVTDLDGTLLHSDRTVSATNLATLEHLGRHRILRVIATGRSLYSAYKVLPTTFPLDYLIFSSGAGILDWHTQRLLIAHHLSTEEIACASRLLIDCEIDFMIHRPIPDNHYFSYYATGRNNPDFLRRCKLYRTYASPLEDLSHSFDKACQFVAIASKERSLFHYEPLKTQLNTLKVIRTTSPLDGESVWIEIFPQSVSKGLAGEWLAQKHNIDRATIFALGNDYNDLDLLGWAETRAVVSNAPPDMKQLYRVVASNNNNGFTEAVKKWINN